jgi:uncharacterized surface anchored protein
MKYIVRCKKTLYYDWTINSFDHNKSALKKKSIIEDLFNNRIILVSKKDQLAIVEDFEEGSKVKLDILAGKTYEVDFKTVQQHFDLIYLNDVCFETKQKFRS